VRQPMRSEDGTALPVATGLLLVVSLLVVGFFTVSLRVNETSGEDKSSKRALAAAEAGLQTAIYRLNSLNASALANASNCLRAGWEAPLGSGECNGLTESIGNGASYTYYVTPASATASGSCATVPGIATTSGDRCITSTGTVNGVTRRIQTRVVQTPSVPDFNAYGLVGKALVYAWNSVNMTTDVGSNEEVRFENSVTVNDNDSINVDGKVVLLTGGDYNAGNSVNVEGGTQTTSTPFDMGEPVPTYETVENSNNNANLTTDLGTAWNSTTRRINLATGERTIRPGTYHTCGVFLGNSVKLKFSHTGNARTKIYVDSPSRTGSMCAGQSDPAGTFGADNSVEINKEVGQREELLDIYLHGTNFNDTRNRYSWCTDLNGGGLEAECRSDFMLDNSVYFEGSIYSPNSTVQAHNSVTITGSVAANSIRFYNSISFNLTGPTINKPAEAPGAATRKGWVECKPTATTASDPESGC
jgi:Tfp pilus assembly protein PilX